jgi:hypothetical protein
MPSTLTKNRAVAWVMFCHSHSGIGKNGGYWSPTWYTVGEKAVLRWQDWSKYHASV